MATWATGGNGTFPRAGLRDRRAGGPEEAKDGLLVCVARGVVDTSCASVPR